MWKEQTWLVGSSLALPSKFGMTKGSLVSIVGQPTSWCIGSFIKWLKSGRLNPTIRGSMGATRIVPEIIPLNVTTRIEPKATPGWVPTPALCSNMVNILMKEA